MNITLKSIPIYMHEEALNVANIFNSQFKGKVGIRNGVAYQKTTKALYAYRTETGNIVVLLSS